MPISSALSIATTGLQAANARAQVAAGNVANASTPGYVRRVAVLDEQQLAGQGAGVQVRGIDRVAAQSLTAERLRMAGQSADASLRSETMTAVARAFGGPSDESGVFAAYVRFENALRDAAATPESVTTLEGLAASARNLASRLNEADAALAQERSRADQAIGDTVRSVNGALDRLAELNRLAPSEVTPAIQDERQRLIDRVNDAVPVTVLNKGDQVHLTTKGGVFLLTESAHPLTFTETTLVGRDHALGAPLSGLTVDGVDVTPGGAGAQRIEGGAFAALFAARDDTLPGMQNALDALAGDLLSRFSADAVDPTKTPGEAGLFTDGNSASAVPLGAGIAGRLQLNAAADPGAGGDAVLLRDGLGAVAPGPAGNGDQLNRLLSAFTSGQGAANGAADLAGEIGAASQDAAERRTITGVRLQVASDAELSVLGVDTDRELQDLLAIEQAYAANARVIQTVSDMMDALMMAMR